MAARSTRCFLDVGGCSTCPTTGSWARRSAVSGWRGRSILWFWTGRITRRKALEVWPTGDVRTGIWAAYERAYAIAAGVPDDRLDDAVAELDVALPRRACGASWPPVRSTAWRRWRPPASHWPSCRLRRDAGGAAPGGGDLPGRPRGGSADGDRDRLRRGRGGQTRPGHLPARPSTPPAWPPTGPCTSATRSAPDVDGALAAGRPPVHLDPTASAPMSPTPTPPTWPPFAAALA